MNFRTENSNNNLVLQQEISTPLFTRLAWFAEFEKYICNENFSAQTFTYTDKDKQLILPLAISDKKLKSLTNYYSPFYQLLTNQKVTESDIQQIVMASKDELEKYDIIDLLPLYKADAQCWQNAFEKIGFKSFIYQHSINWYHDNIIDLDQYWSLRPSKLRNTLKRKKNKLDKTGEYITKVTCPKSLTELNLYLTQYHHVYYDSWKKVEPYPAFIDAIVKYAWQQGELRLGLVYHKDIPIAAQIWFVNGPTAYIFKLAYRRDYTKTSVGTVLTAAMIEYVIEQDKISCIDFLTGDDDYKKDWMQSKRELMGIQACNLSTLTGKREYVGNVFSKLRKALTT
ncbi:MAG: GNAT family N-acetyltransferase [Colwellia sp.]|nr:GNAT family N-acetyltransferase [Colwellia sp.]MCW8866505.1 GNAT family N-acetyltransferase [Colwellia sp.]MCW9080694.1 GNAT family N-acetyltransferase [Colwellia sp.]